MRNSRLSKLIQAKLIEHFVARTTARCTSELVDVHRNTAAYYFHRLREIMAWQCEQESHEVFGGDIEVDESYLVVHAKESEAVCWW